MSGVQHPPESTISIEFIREKILYCPYLGTFQWKDPNETRKILWCEESPRLYSTVPLVPGTTTGYQAHRVAWAFWYGEWPQRQLDHINRNKKDNRLVNLRLATPKDNRYNQEGRTGKYKGVVSRKTSHPEHPIVYVARLSDVQCGTYATEDEAAVAYNKAALQEGGEFAFLNEVPNGNLIEPKRLYLDHSFQRQRLPVNNKSGFRGVAMSGNRFYAICNGKRLHKAYFKDPVEAAKIYDKEAYHLWGADACLNFPEDFNLPQ